MPAEKNWSWLTFDAQTLSLKKGDFLFQQGTEVRNMYFIISGRVKLIRHSADGEQNVLHVATAGEMIAEASFFSTVYHCHALADQATELNTTNRDFAINSILNCPDTSLAMMRLFAQQIRELRGLHEIRNIRSAQARVLAYLSTLAKPDGKIQLDMSLQDMAYKLGLAHETLYRALKQLETQGQITRPAKNTFMLKLS